MAEFNTPDSRLEIYNKMLADVSISTSGQGLRVNLVKTMLVAISGRIYDVYRKRLNIFKQSFLKTCSDDYLTYHGEPYGITLLPATQAEGKVIFGGVQNYTIPQGTQVQSINSISYITQSDGTVALQQITPLSVSRTGTVVTVTFSNAIDSLASGFTIDSITGANEIDFNVTNQIITKNTTNSFQFEKIGTQGSATGTIIVQWKSVSIPVKSISTGISTNLAHGSITQLSSPILNILSNAYVDYDGITNGNNVEDLVSYRKRIEYRIQNPISFFNESYIISKAQEVNGVTRVKVFSPDTTTAQISISSITRYDNVAIATSNNHLLTDNSYVKITGATPNDYNIYTKIVKLDANRFAFYIPGTPSNPTGTIVASYTYIQPGQVRVGILRDRDDSIIASSTEVSKVKNKLLEKKIAIIDPSDIIVFSPTPVAINYVFSFLSPNTNAMRSAITKSLYNYHRSENQIGVNEKLDIIKSIIKNTFDSTGVKPDFTLTSPNTDTVIGLQQISTLGTITFL
jgi:uncharacterized phage protein gp47/JayE